MKIRQIISKAVVVTWLMVLDLVQAVHAQTEKVSESPTVKEVAVSNVNTAKHLIDVMAEWVVKYSLQVMGGVIVLVLGWIVAGYAARLTSKALAKHHIDVTIMKFIVGGVKLFIMAFAVVVALGKFGIEIAPFIAGISVAGFGLSFALQGPLSNYASGATLIFTKPFKVGDIIEVAGIAGEVTDIQLPRTEVKTIDGHKIVIPNKHIIGEIIHNYSTAKRVDIDVGVSYKSDVEQAMKVMEAVIANEKRIVNAAHAGILSFGDSSVNLHVSVWCKQDDYWDVLFALNKNIFEAFKRENIEIPFPQRDVRILKDV